MTDVLQQAGFRGRSLTLARAVMSAESRGNAQAHNTNASTGDNSYGLFQINMLGGLGPARLQQYGLKDNTSLFDPLTNAKVAFQMSRGGTDWSPWSTYKSGAYKQFLGKGGTPGGVSKAAHALATTPTTANGKLDPVATAMKVENRGGLQRQALVASLLGSLNSFASTGKAAPIDVGGVLRGVQQQQATLPAVPGAKGAAPVDPGAPPAPTLSPRQKVAPGAWTKFVYAGPNADRAGVHTSPSVYGFIGHLGASVGQKLEIGTGTNHKQITQDGNVSDHWGGHAADVPASGNALLNLGYHALIQAGMRPAQAKKAADSGGGLFNVGHTQIIFGNYPGHSTHLHVGIR